jgi:hypothetical protein
MEIALAKWITTSPALEATVLFDDKVMEVPGTYCAA